MKARESITIENVGKKFSGNWRITKITHTISNDGYKCSLSLSKNDYSGGSGGKTSGAAPKSSQGTKSNAKSAGDVKQGQNNSQTKSNKPSDIVYDLNTRKRVQ